MKFILKILIIILSSLLLGVYAFSKDIVIDDIHQTILLWFNKAIPSLIVMYFISSLLISSKAIDIIIFILKPFRKLLRFETDNAFGLYIISILVGNPSTSQYIKKYLENGFITANDAENLLLSASFMNPLFIITMIKSLKIALILYVSHFLGNILFTMFLTRKNHIRTRQISVDISFWHLINKLPNLLFTICIYMIISSLLTLLLKEFNVPSIYLSFLEISNGFNILLSHTENCYYLLVMLTSFNGLCIHMQVMTTLEDLKYYKLFLLGRLVTTILSLIIFITGYHLF